MKSIKSNPCILLILLLSGCSNQKEQALVSVGHSVFILSGVACFLNASLSAFSIWESFKDFLFSRPRLIKSFVILISLLLAISGLPLIVYGFQQKGVTELWGTIGLCVLIISLLLPRSINLSEKEINLKGVGIFTTCVYVQAFLIFSGESLFELF